VRTDRRFTGPGTPVPWPWFIHLEYDTLRAMAEPRCERGPWAEAVPHLGANALFRAGFRTLAQIAASSDTELLLCRGFGRRSLEHIRALEHAGFVGYVPCPACGGRGTVPAAPAG